MYGLWEQIRVDCGTEFILTLFVQEKLRQQYGSTEIAPFVQLHLPGIIINPPN